MKKVFISILVLLLFTTSLAAESAYVFSSFGGGLPSSAVKQSEVEEVALYRSSGKQLTTSDIVWITVGSVVLAAAIVGTVYYLTAGTAKGSEYYCSDDGECTEMCTAGCSDMVVQTCTDGRFQILPKMLVYVP